jgi:hypothetical protein
MGRAEIMRKCGAPERKALARAASDLVQLPRFPPLRPRPQHGYPPRPPTHRFPRAHVPSLGAVQFVSVLRFARKRAQISPAEDSGTVRAGATASNAWSSHGLSDSPPRVGAPDQEPRLPVELLPVHRPVHPSVEQLIRLRSLGTAVAISEVEQRSGRQRALRCTGLKFGRRCDGHGRDPLAAVVGFEPLRGSRVNPLPCSGCTNVR